jgi:adenosylcobyric acid synthase
MNPVLLKPEADNRSQVIVSGRVMETIAAADYYRHAERLLNVISGSLDRLRSSCDIVVIEGAGSPAEVNLKDREIVNMRIARLARSPVLLVGDIDRGGVFAALTGTLHLLAEEERALVKGLIVNKFRGDIGLFKSGIDFLEKETGKPVLGVIPYIKDIGIAQEDSVYLDGRNDVCQSGSIDIAIVRLPHISNYDDFDPLEGGDCRVRYVGERGKLGHPHLIIVPGSKSTAGDLDFLYRSGMADEIIRLAAEGTPVLGICGGYQILGREIKDPEGVESAACSVRGLGLLDMETVFDRQKRTAQVTARVTADRGILSGLKGQQVSGYEIHMGRCLRQNEQSAFCVFQTPQGEAGYADGAVNAGGNVVGTYIHGIFSNDAFRQSFLDSLRRYYGLSRRNDDKVMRREDSYNRLADTVRRHLDMDKIYEIIEAGVE